MCLLTPIARSDNSHNVLPRKTGTTEVDAMTLETTRITTYDTASTRSERRIFGSTQTQTKSASTMLVNDKSIKGRPSSCLSRYAKERQISATANTPAPTPNSQKTVAFEISKRKSPNAHSRNANVSSSGPLKCHESHARKIAGTALRRLRIRYGADFVTVC